MIQHCILHISWKHGPEDCRSTILSPARNPIEIWSNFIQLYPSLFSNILMYMEKLILMDIAQKIIWNTYVKPINSCVHTYMMNPDECLMNINILMKNTTTFWCSSWRTQQHSNGQNVHPEFQVKVCGPRTRVITPLDTLQRLYEPKNSINRDQRLSITCTIAKHS